MCYLEQVDVPSMVGFDEQGPCISNRDVPSNDSKLVKRLVRPKRQCFYACPFWDPNALDRPTFIGMQCDRFQFRCER